MFKKKSELIDHMASHGNHEGELCSICGFQTSDTNEMIFHKENYCPDSHLPSPKVILSF